MLISVSSIIRFKEGVIEAIKYAARLGLMHIDIFVANPHFNYLMTDEEIEHLRKFLDYMGMRASLKSPGFVENLASINPDVRKITFKFFKKLIDLAKRINATHVTIKPGMFFFPEKMRKREAYDLLEEGIKRVLSYAEEQNVMILFENYYYPIEALRFPKHFQKIVKFAGDNQNDGFALNIPHLLEAKADIEKLVKMKDVIKRIEVIYLGPRPSPWELKVDYSSIDEVIDRFRFVARYIIPRITILATVREDILIRMLREVV